MKVSIEYSKTGRDNVCVVIEPDDLWNGDVTLSRVIYPFLKKYRKLYDRKKDLVSYPAEFAPDLSKPEGPHNPDRFQEWLLCLDKMIYSFEWIAKHGNWEGPAAKEYYRKYNALLKPYKKELKKLAQEDAKRFEEAELDIALESLEAERIAEITQPLLLEYCQKFEEHRNKLQEGIDLFAKYFRQFWL